MKMVAEATAGCSFFGRREEGAGRSNGRGRGQNQRDGRDGAGRSKREGAGRVSRPERGEIAWVSPTETNWTGWGGEEGMLQDPCSGSII